jgi:lipopolysaccharide transport system ATP-binding protein
VPSAECAISVRGVGKRYDIYTRTVDRVKHLMTAGTKSFGKPFWALRDVSMEVKRGEAVGVVGRNGSGKSTLMQIIAGTLAPSEGEVHIRGRVSALLELGSGFNPQFTGRENVFLAGSILGMTRKEVEAKFDSVAAFADIGEFMEQPVEVYSSGMHARLAFSVAVCVEPDILIVDEILSVGDAGFQQKCISRMKKMLDGGLTLLLVSHSADMVKSICGRALFLEKGSSVAFGSAGEVVERYTERVRAEVTERALANVTQRGTVPALIGASGASGVGNRAVSGAGTGHGRIMSVRVLDERGAACEAFVFGQTIVVEATLVCDAELDRLDLMFVVRDKAGVDLFGSTAIDEGAMIRMMSAGERRLVRITFVNTLAPGPHGVAMTFTRRPDSKGEGLLTLDHRDNAAAFEVVGGKRVVRGKMHVDVGVSVGSVDPAVASR